MASAGPPPGAHVTYSRQYRRCTKPGCPSCGTGRPGHGPYWYAYWREGGRRCSRYLGKDRHPGVVAPTAAGFRETQGHGDDTEIPEGLGDAATGVNNARRVVTANAVALEEPVTAAARMPVTGGAATGVGVALRVRTLGGFALWRGGQRIPAEGVGRGALRLMQCLLSAPAYRMHRDQLLEAFWPEADPATGAARLRRMLHILRRLIDWPGTEASHLRWEGELLALIPLPGGDAPPDWLDAAAFRRDARLALQGEDLDACRAALALYGGEYLPEEPYAEWAAGTREALARQHLGLLLHLAALCRVRDAPAEAERCVREALAADPCHEEAAQALMELLQAGGRRGQALRVYQEVAAALDRELGLGPQAALEGLRSRLLAEAATPVAADFVPRLPVGRPSNLPAPVSSFIGRSWERGELRTLLESTRLLTLTGAGGCGKSRLALEVAGELLDHYADGVWQVELAALSDPALVQGAVAAVLGVKEQPGRPLVETLTAFLGPRQLLLLLDNCEHLIEACAGLAAALLRACPQLRILATSRQVLGLEGEVTWLVAALAYPNPEAAPSPAELAGYEAVQLFVARARAHRPTFVLDETNAGAVAQVCAGLDGIPLALELAAARMGALSVAEVAGRLGDRFALLTGGSRVAWPRQQTLRAMIDWSWDLLGEAERVLLRRLAVFAGGWTLEAATAVCEDQRTSTAEARTNGDDTGRTDSTVRAGSTKGGGGGTGPALDGGTGMWAQGSVLDLLAGLVSQSLVQVNERDGQSRYSLLETVRQYGQERLEEAGEVAMLRWRHLAWYLELAELAEAELQGLAQATWLARLEGEHDNLRAALSWAAEAEAAEPGLRLAGALWRFWAHRGHLREGLGWLERALASGESCAPSARAKALNGAGNLARRQGDFGQAVSLYEQSLAIERGLGDRHGIAASLGNLGLVAEARGAYGRGEALFEEALTLFRELGDRWAIATSLGNLGLVAYQLGEYGRASALHEEGLAIERELGDKHGIAYSLNNLGIVVYQQGAYGRAAALHEEALALRRIVGDRYGIAASLGNLGLVAYQLGEYGKATALHEEGLAVLRDLGDRHGIAQTLNNLGLVAYQQGEYGRAAALLEESLALKRELGDRYGIAYALIDLGWVALRQGQDGQAAALVGESLQISREIGARDLLAAGLESLAWVAGAGGQPRRAARLGGAAEALREALGVPLPPDQRGCHEQALQTIRTALGVEAFAVAWAGGAALTPEQAVDEALASA